MNSNMPIAHNSSSSSHAAFSSTLENVSSHKEKADVQLYINLQSAVSNEQSLRGEDTMNNLPSWFFELSQENESLKQKNKDLVQEKIKQESEVVETEVKVSELLNQLVNAEMKLEKENEKCEKYEREKSMLKVQVEKLMTEVYRHGHKKHKACKDEENVELNKLVQKPESEEKSQRLLVACRSQLATKNKSIRKMEVHIKQIWKILVEFGNTLASSELLAAQQKWDLLKICEEYRSFKFLSRQSGTDIYNTLNTLSTTSELRRVATDLPKANIENEDEEVFAVENSPSIFITPNHETSSGGNSSVKMSYSSQDIQIEFDKNQDGDGNPALHDVANCGQKEASFANIQMSFSIAPFLELNSPNEVTTLEKNNEPSKSDCSPYREIEFEDSLKLPVSADKNSFSDTVKTFFNDLGDESNPLFNESDSGQGTEVPIGNPASKIVGNSVHSVKETLMEDLYLSEDSFDNPDDMNTLNHHVPMESSLSIENSSLAFDQSDTKLKNTNSSKDVVSSDFSTLAKGNKLIQDSGDFSFALVEENKLKHNSDDCPALMNENEMKHNSKYLPSNLVKENRFGQASDDLSTCLVIENELIQTPDDVHSTLVKENKLMQEKDLSCAKVNETESIENIDDLPSALVKENELTHDDEDPPSAFVKENESIENTDDLPKALMKENELIHDNEDPPSAFAKENESIENTDDLPKALMKENELIHDNEDPPSAFAKENESIENTDDLPKALMKENELIHDNEDPPSAFAKENESIENTDDLPKALMKENESTQDNDDLSSALVKEDKSKQTYDDLLFALMKESNLGQNCIVFPSVSEKENKLIQNACVESTLVAPITTLSPTSTPLKEQHESLNSISHGSTNKTCADNQMSIIETTDPFIGIANVQCDNEDSHGSPKFRINSSTPLRGYVNFSHSKCPSISTGNSDYVQKSLNKEIAVVNTENIASIGSETSSIDHNVLFNSIHQSSKDCNISDKVLDTTVNDDNKLKTLRNGVENYNLSDSDDMLNKSPSELCTVTAKKCDDGSVKLGFNLIKPCTITLDPNNYNVSCVFKEPEDASRTPRSYKAQFSPTMLSNNSSTVESQNVDDNQFPNSKTQKLSENKPSSPIPLEENIESFDSVFPISQDLIDRELTPQQSDSIASSSNVHKNIPDFQYKRSSEPIEYLSENSFDSSIVPSDSDSSFTVEKNKSSAKRKSNLKRRSKFSQKKTNRKQTAKKTLSKKGKLSGKILKSNGVLEIVEDALKAAEEWRLKILSEGSENDKTHELNSDDNFSSKKNKSHLKSISNHSIFKAKTSQRIKNIKPSKIDSERKKIFPMRQMVSNRQVGTVPSKSDSYFEKVPSEKNLTFKKQVAYEQEPQDIDDSDFSFTEDEPKINDAAMSSNNASFSFEERLKRGLNETGKRRFEDPTEVEDPYALFGSSLLDENNTSHSFENVETELVKSNQSESKNVSTSIADQHKKDFEIVNDDDCSENSKESSPLKSFPTQHPDESTGHVSPTPQTFDNLMLKLFKEFSDNVKDNQISPKNRHASVIDQIKSDFGIIDDNNSSQGNEYSSPLKDTKAELTEILTDTVLPTSQTSEHIKDIQSAPKIASDTIVDKIESDFDVIDDDNCSQISEDSSSSKDTIVERPKKLEFTVFPAAQTSVLVKGNHQTSKNILKASKNIQNSLQGNEYSSPLKDTNAELTEILTDIVLPTPQTSEHIKGNQIETDFDVIDEDNCSQISEDSSSKDTIVECQNNLQFTVSPTSHTVLVEGNHHASKNMSVSTKCQIKSDFNTVEDNCSQSTKDSCPRNTNHEYLDELTDPVFPIPQIPNNENNKNLALKGVFANNCDVSIYEDYTKSTCSRGVEKVNDALEDPVVIPGTFEEILIKHMKENKIVEKQPKPSNFIELIKNNSHVSFEDILTAHLEDVKVLEGNQNSSNASELEKSIAAPIENSSTLGHDTDSQVSELDLFMDENSVSSDSEDTTKCEDSRISSNDQLSNAVTTQVDFGVLSSDNIISQFSSQASELMECNKNLRGSLVDKSDAPDAKDCQLESEGKTVRVAITSRPSPVQVGGGRIFKTKDSATKCVDKVNSVQNCESIENLSNKTVENNNCIINEAVEEDLTEGEAIPVLEKSITKHKEKQKMNTIKNYFSKSVCVDATAEVLSMNKNLLTDKANINDNNGCNFSGKSYSKNKVDNLIAYQTVDAESDQNVCNATKITNFTKNKISHEIKECFVLLKRNEALSKDISSDIAKDNEDLFGSESNKSYLEKSNKYKEKIPVHKCEFSVNSIQTPSRYANLVGKNIESFRGIKNKASVLEIARNILATSIKGSSCIDELGITTNKKPSLCESARVSGHEQESPIGKDISTDKYDIFCSEDELDKEVSAQQCFLPLENVKTPTKCVNSEMSMQQCHVALDPVVISSSIVNATEKVHDSLTVQKKSNFVDKNKLCSFNKEKSPSNEALRTSPRLSTHDANTLADIKQIRDFSKDAPTKTQNRTCGKRKIEDTERIDFKAKKKFKLQECFVLIEPLNLSSQWEHNNPAAVETKQSSKENPKISHSKMNIDTSDNAEVVDCVIDGKVRKTRNHTKKLDGYTKGQNSDDVIKTNVSSSSNNWSGINQNSISIETRNQRKNVFFLNQTSTYGVHTRLSSGIQKSTLKPKTAINKKGELITKEIQSESNEGSSCALSKQESSYSKYTNCEQNKRALRRSKRKNSANLESTTSKQVCSELKAKTIEDYFQLVHSTHLYDTDFDCSAHSLKAILSNTENYPDMSSLLFAVIKYLSLSEKNILLSFAKSKKMSVLFPEDEDCLITAFFMIESDEKTHLKGLLKATVNMIQNLLISRKTINIYGLASLCRVATEISKRKKDKLAPLTLCSNLLKSKHQFSPYLIASVISIWMELFQVQDDLSDEEIIFHSSIAYGAKKRTDITESDWNVSMNIISKYQNSRPVADVQKSINVLINIIQINCCDESWIHCYMLTSALVIFAVHEDWNWIKENLLNQFIVPELNKFGTKTILDKAFDLFCNLYVDLFLMNPSTNPREEVLIKFFKKENMTEGCSFIQENAALALMKFLVLKNIRLPRILTRWFEKNRDNLKVIAIRTLFTRKSKSGDNKQLVEEDFELNII